VCTNATRDKFSYRAQRVDEPRLNRQVIRQAPLLLHFGIAASPHRGIAAQVSPPGVKPWAQCSAACRSSSRCIGPQGAKKKTARAL
jgi:hypothetical protein